jgi:transcriptional regulator with XRE-family HTH domain
MTAAIFEGTVDQDAVEHRQTRRMALGGALQLIRLRNGWNVNDAASRAGIAPMTWRRMEDGQNVRANSYAAVDKLLGLTFGAVKRALNDDLLMVQEIVKLTGTDVRHVASDNAHEFLSEFARTTAKGPGAVQQLFTDPGGIRIMHHPDTGTQVLDEHNQPRPWQPRDLQLIGQLVELVSPFKGVPAIDELMAALKNATPVLIDPPQLRAALERLGQLELPDLPDDYDQPRPGEDE